MKRIVTVKVVEEYEVEVEDRDPVLGTAFLVRTAVEEVQDRMHPASRRYIETWVRTD